MKINITKPMQMDAKILDIHLKVSDMFAAALLDQEGVTLKEYDGYVPDFMPGDHHGDYVILKIDIDTGQILNWEKPSAEQLERFIAGNEV